MDHACSIDRFEGTTKQVAVLVFDDGATINLPRALLPPGAKAGDVLTLSLRPDPQATRRLARETKALQDELRQTDPGGDLAL